MKTKVEKPWGSYQVLDNGPSYQVKKIIVNQHGFLKIYMLIVIVH